MLQCNRSVDKPRTVRFAQPMKVCLIGVLGGTKEGGHRQAQCFSTIPRLLIIQAPSYNREST